MTNVKPWTTRCNAEPESRGAVPLFDAQSVLHCECDTSVSIAQGLNDEH